MQISWQFGLACVLLSAALTGLNILICRRRGYMIQPRAERWSRTAVAQFGGVPILLTFLLGAAWLPLSGPLPMVVGLTGVMALLGFWDDLRPLEAHWKFLLQILLAVVVMERGVVYPFPEPPWNLLFTLLWIVGITNAFNLLDNMDGLAAGVGIIAAANLAFLVHEPHSGPAQLTLVLAASLLGFLFFNFHPAKVFMGDTGSLALGFFLACSAVLGSQRVSSTLAAIFVPALTLFLPIFDTLLVSVTRRLGGRAISQGARDHTSHRLVSLGIGERRAVVFLYIVSALSCGVAFTWKVVWPELGPGILLLFLIVAALFWLYVAQIEVPEDWLSRTTVLTISIPKFLKAVGERASRVFLDVLLIILAMYLAFLLRFDSLESHLAPFLLAAGLAIAIKVPLLTLFAGYHGSWAIRALRNVYPILKASVLGFAFLVTLLTYLQRFHYLSRAVFAIDMVLTVALLVAVRCSYRMFEDSLGKASANGILLVGGSSGLFFQHYFAWKGGPGKLLGVVVENGVPPAQFDVPVIRLEQVPSLLENGAVQSVYLLPDCPEEHRREVVRKCLSRQVGVYDFDVHIDPATGEARPKTGRDQA